MKKIYFFLVFFIFAANFSIYSQESGALPEAELMGTQPAPRGLTGTISVDLRNISVLDALRYLAQTAGINIVTTEAVTGRVSLSVEDVPIKDVFDIILRSNNLAYDKQGEIYNVMTESQYRSFYGERFGDIREVEIFRVNYAIPEQIFSLLDAMKSEVGKVVVDPESGSVLVMDSRHRIKQMQKAMQTFDKESVVRVFNLNYADPEMVERQLQNQLDAKNVGYIRAHSDKNQVVVQTLAHRMNQIEDLISRLDKKTKEVFIDIKIVDVLIGDSLKEELEWEGLLQLASNKGLTYLGSTPFASIQSEDAPWRSRLAVLQGGYDAEGEEVVGVGHVGSYPFSGTTRDMSSSRPVIPGEALHFGKIGRHDFDVFYRYLQTVGETRVIITPKLVAVHNRPAKLHVGEKQAYVTTTTTTGQAIGTVAEDVTFIDVGTLIEVTPFINDDNYITLDVSIEVSSVVSVLVTPTQNEIPILGTTKAETRAMVQDGVTVVIGGLRRDGRSEDTAKVPFLGDIPFLGRAFRSRSPETERRELLIVMTPHIVEGDVLIDEKAGRPVDRLRRKEIKEIEEEERLLDEIIRDKLEPKGLR